ncbi:AMIN domain-containing protein [Desulforhopalus vacuolatus]|uniref:AMIN domain-containing protein n=1 Tax=Desulforhopalus vacuolatus TaxID=40414 RepID=UPI001962C424|nr:AMIN domain-containing protein [Desulforhopalus vacuolatus]MBM9519800.1 AMIN domain-containing protein [Desulforhopalus vacuolatus]
MKKILFSAVLALSCGLLSLLGGVAMAANYSIAPVQFTRQAENIEVLSFETGPGATYNIFALKGANPRVVIDFTGGKYTGQNGRTLENSTLVRQIRVAWHRSPEKTRVVLDLMPDSQVSFTDSLQGGVLKIVLVSGHGTAVPAVTQEAGVAASTASPQKIAARTINKKPSAKAGGGELRKITFTGNRNEGERIDFTLNGFYPPVITVGEGITPQIFCEFKDTIPADDVTDVVPSSDGLVQKIQIKKEKGGVQVSLDLVKNKNFSLHQYFYRDNSTFTLVIKERVAGEKN